MSKQRKENNDKIVVESEKVREAMSLYNDAMNMYNTILTKEWDVRFAQVEVVALMDVNKVYMYLNEYDLVHKLNVRIDKNLIAPVPIDLRVVLQWDTDATNVELHVTEPNGQECYSFNDRTKNGGLVSRDFTSGYGPVEYVLRSAKQGTYDVSVKLFSSRKLFTGTTVFVKIFTNFGSPGNESEVCTTMRLHEDKQTFHVCTVSI
mmetsp:Transcript_27952/g.31080  ORF Transcript_27952/g.31080 Transcript_27952/m.31080 type:complete len:205 (+) Transcript_27952:32-646(+)